MRVPNVSCFRGFSFTFTLALAAAAAATAVLFPAGPGWCAEEIDGLAATVNGKVITLSEVRQAIAVRAQVEGMGNHRYTREEFEAVIAQIEKEALQDLIDRELILDAFVEKGGNIRDNFIDDSINKFILERFEGDRKKFIDELRDTGMTLKQFREMREEALIVQYMRQNETGQIPPTTPAELQEGYKENQDRFRGKDFVSLRTITIPKAGATPGATPESQKKLAGEIRTKIAEGADFGLMAKTYSEDSKASKGGEWGTIQRDDFKPLLSDAAFSLSPQTVSEILEDERNYYLLWVDAVQRGNVTPLAEVREEVDQLVQLKKRKDAHEKWIARLRENANISIFEKFTISE